MVMVNQKVKDCVGWYDSRLSRERQRVINYYNSVLPKRQHLGSSPYISTDVYDAVESMKAQVVETFSANPDNLISFPPNGDKDVEPSREATEYCNHVFFAENPGEAIMTSWVHDGLTARTGVVMAYWDKREEETDETIDGASYDQVQALAARPEIKELDADEDDQRPGVFKGKLTRVRDTSQVVVENIPPEEFLITPRCPSIEFAAKVGAVARRQLKTRAELKKLYPKMASKIDELHYDDDRGLDMGPEVLARNMPVETHYAFDDPIQPELQQTMFYESYATIDMRDGRGAKLWKICHAGEVLFDKEEVDHVPFIDFCPLPIPYMFYGNNFAARVIPTQNARTVLTRGILDHTAITTNPRWGVVKGGVLNPREMLENRLGGVVNLTRPDAVVPFQYSNLNPFVFQTIEMLKQNKEESTGISALSQGLNKDAISTQNSAALVDNLVNLSQTRQKMLARRFAESLSKLYLLIYRLVLENQNKEAPKIVKVAGNFVPVSTQDWVERNTCKVALHLGYGERDREAAKHQALYRELSADPALQNAFGLPQRVKLASDGMKMAGFANWDQYLNPNAQPPQPDPIKMGEMQAKQTDSQSAMITAQANAQRVQQEGANDAFKRELEEIKLHLQSLIGIRAETRKDAEAKNKIDVSQRETEVLEKQPIKQVTGTISAPH